MLLGRTKSKFEFKTQLQCCEQVLVTHLSSHSGDLILKKGV